ncbi:MAG: acetyl-CoA carboxylase biotin carboxylase subunit [Anaerolineae bacterium]|nr:acetyl-CoA carboxylase biotin carboxylase subunit [Anaerolineae bacterium]
MPLHKCLIANRGEIAVRILRGCHELGVHTVAVYSEVDANGRHVQLADEAYLLGAANPADSYLNIPKLIDAARRSGADCVHPGYGFLSEVEDFAQAVLDAGLVWIGPPPEAIRLMGVKTEARALMGIAGVPLVPGYQSNAQNDADFVAAADQIGYPVMVKAAGGGGGKGIRVVYERRDLPEALAAARREALHAFGDPRVFLERYIEHGRHIEVQVLADQFGHTVHLFERECSAQRRHQKVIEESPSPLLTPEIRARMGAAAVEAARAVHYVNAGTVEFIAAPTGEFYFLEMNTRLQVEHPVTEMVTGLDLVKLQIAIAAGEPLPFTQADLTQRGHAIECRLYAEDAPNGFLPAVGTLLEFIPPSGLGVRVDSGVGAGDAITIHYDPMIAKLIVYDWTRDGAIQRMDAALRDTVILGTTTNLTFLRALINHPAFQAGEVDTNFIETHLAELLPPESALPKAALIAAALHDLTTSSPDPLSQGRGGSERYSVPDPWARTDGFRIG